MTLVIVGHPVAGYSGYQRAAGRGFYFSQGETELVDLTPAQQTALTSTGYTVDGLPDPPTPDPYPQYPTLPEVRQFVTTDEAVLAAQRAASDAREAAARRVVDAIGGWWIYPQAAYTANPPRTYIGGVSTAGQVVCGYFDHLLRKSRRYVLATGSPDDHNAPAVSPASGYRTVAVWSKHNADNFLYYAVTGLSGDPATFSAPQSLNTGLLTSYAQVHRLPSDPNQFWVFFRGRVTGQYRWAVVKGTIAPLTGVVTWGAVRDLVLAAQPAAPAVGDQDYMTTTPDGAGGLRFAYYGHPDNSALRTVHYGAIDLATGAVSSPGKTLAGNIGTGTGLPLVPADLAVAYTPAADHSVRLFAVSGQGNPTLALADWATASAPATATYRTLTYTSSADPGLAVAAGGYATTPGTTAMNGTSYSIRWLGKITTLGISQTLARRFNATGNQRSWVLTLLSSNAVRFQRFTDGTASNSYDSSVALPYAAGALAGIRVDYDGATGSATIYTGTAETLAGVTWTQLGTVRTGTAVAPFAADTTAPLQVAADSASTFAGTVREFELTVGGTVRSYQNFADGGWPAGATTGSTDSDPQGNLWTLGGAATINTTGWQPTDFGIAGLSIDASIDHYLGGMAFQGENRILISREAAGVRSLERYVRSGGTWKAETLTSKPGRVGPWRPQPVEGGGPLDAVYSDVTSYGSGYTNYSAEVVGV